MEKGYYKDPKTGEITKGCFEDAWKSFVDGFKEDEYYDADEAQLDDEDEFPVPYDDEGIPLGENEDEYYDAKEADRLEKHPEKDIIKKIQKMMNKEKKSSNK